MDGVLWGMPSRLIHQFSRFLFPISPPASLPAHSPNPFRINRAPPPFILPQSIPFHPTPFRVPLFQIPHSFPIQLKAHKKMPGELQSPSIEQLPKMPTGMQTEVAQRAGLKHVETTEKNVLPTKEDLEEERKHENFKKGIQEFDKNHQLRHVEAEEKVVLPSSQDIANEKAPKLAAEFDKSGLRHVEPNVKTSVEVIEKGEE